MKKLRAVSISHGLVASALKSLLSLLAIAALAGAFWFASAPLAKAARSTPGDLLQSSLPGKMTLATASKPDVLTAVCGAITKSRDDAPEIVRTAAGARRELSSDIVSQAVRCSKGQATDCGLVQRILHAGTEADPAHAARLTEVVLGLAPDCGLDNKDVSKDVSKDIPAEAPVGVVNNINPPPGSSGGGGGPSSCSVCHNGHAITVACDSVDDYLHGHPGDTSGPCQTTPNQNR